GFCALTIQRFSGCWGPSFLIIRLCHVAYGSAGASSCKVTVTTLVILPVILIVCNTVTIGCGELIEYSVFNNYQCGCVWVVSAARCVRWRSVVDLVSYGTAGHERRWCNGR